MLKKILILTTVFILTATWLMACGGNDAPAGGEDQPEQENPQMAI